MDEWKRDLQKKITRTHTHTQTKLNPKKTGMENVILIFRALLSECKILFLSKYEVLLTNVIEGMLSFLQPLGCQNP